MWLSQTSHSLLKRVMNHLGIVQNMHPLCFDDIKAGLVSHQNTNICVWKQPPHIFPPKWLTFGDHLLCPGWFLQVSHRWTHLSWMTIIVALIFQESQQRLTILHKQFKLTQRTGSQERCPVTISLWPFTLPMGSLFSMFCPYTLHFFAHIPNTPAPSCIRTCAWLLLLLLSVQNSVYAVYSGVQA